MTCLVKYYLETETNIVMNNFKRNIRSYCYDRIQEHSAGTPFLYEKALTTMFNNTSVLEIGIGNGICIEKNAEKIRSKNLTIKGLDIDKEYLQICQQRIIQNNLTDNVSCALFDLLKIDEKEQYDYIFYPGSYPVIAKGLMKTMLDKSKKLLRDDNSRIIFSHSLYMENKNTSKTMLKILDIIKKKLKYVPMIWTDFGRMTTVTEFENLLTTHNLKVSRKIEVGIAEEKSSTIKKYFLQLIGLTFKSEHYIYSVKPTD